MDPIVRFENVRKAYGSLEVLHDLTLRVEQGDVVTLIGRSGSRKEHRASLHQRLGENQRRGALCVRSCSPRGER